MLKKILKLALLFIFSAAGIATIVGVIFVKTSPQFGAKPTNSEIKSYESLDYFNEGKFQNTLETNMDMSFGDGMKLMGQFFRGVKNGKPNFDIPVLDVDSLRLEKEDSTRIIWFGHSAFLVQTGGLNILIDPMLGDVPAPHPMLGTSRFSEKLPIEIEMLPQIDLILISHDHYDHLDYGSIMKLKDKTKQFAVPLGVKAHLRSWGVSENNIKEFQWWDEWTFEGVEFAFTPSRHFSGRGPTDRWSTLWGSWVIDNGKDNIYFSGDGGYGPHFKEIGEKFGPFDFAMLECGQYNELWSEIHMMPEETAIAGVDLKANIVMPIHWGAFTLALHSWTDPIVRLQKKADELGLALTIPKIGEEIRIETNPPELVAWWQN